MDHLQVLTPIAGPLATVFALIVAALIALAILGIARFKNPTITIAALIGLIVTILVIFQMALS